MKEVKESLGQKIWVIPDGHIPFYTHGKEPELISQDRISILNTNPAEVEVKLSVFYEKEEPIAGYKIKIGAQRLRCIRINDIIDPLPVELEKPYALQVEAEIPLVVQFTRMNTGSEKAAIMGTIAFGTG